MLADVLRNQDTTCGAGGRTPQAVCSNYVRNILSEHAPCAHVEALYSAFANATAAAVNASSGMSEDSYGSSNVFADFASALANATARTLNGGHKGGV